MKTGIIDGHCHLWKQELVQRTWLTPRFGPLFRSFTPADLDQVARRNGVERCVLIESGATAEDNAAMEEAASSGRIIGAFLPCVDLANPGLEKQLEAWQANPKFRGVRAPLEDHPDSAIFTRAAIIDGCRSIARRGLVFEFIVKVRHLDGILALYDLVPELKGVINHMAKPDMVVGKEREQWRGAMRSLAANTSILCKLSLSPRMDAIDDVLQGIGRGWPLESIKPYVQFLLEEFGPRRTLWGSDWPICLLTSNYDDTLDVMRRAMGPLDGAAENNIFRATAAKFYGLQEASSTQGLSA